MIEIKNKKIIITGGAGFIGSNLVEALAKENQITVIDNMHTGSEENLAEAMKSGNVKLIKDDVKNINKNNLSADIIFHLGFASSSPMYRENPYLVGEGITGMIAVLENARKNKSRLVFASTSTIYNGIKPPHSENAIPLITDYYTETRIAAERLAELYGKYYETPSAGMRFFSVYGRHEKFKKIYANLITQYFWNIQKGEQPVIYGDGTQRRDFTYVSDVVNALISATSVEKFEIFNVGTGKNYSLNEMVEMLNSAMGTDIKPKYIEMPMKNYVMETLADTSKAERLIGFKAKIPLEEGIKKLIEGQ